MTSRSGSNFATDAITRLAVPSITVGFDLLESKALKVVLMTPEIGAGVFVK